MLVAIRPEVVTEDEPFPPVHGRSLHDMEVMGSSFNRREAERKPAVEVVPGSGATSQPISANALIAGDIWAMSASTATISTIGFATRPGTAVLPMCSMG